MSGTGRSTPNGLLQVASILFFLSGATGLAYQVIWFKRFSYVWGNSSLAMAAVVASFLFGLGVGAYAVGRFADRVRAPLLWYGLFEGLIGLLALGIPLEIQWLVDLGSGFYVHLHDKPVLHSFARFGLTFLVLGPPCILMGGTLPLLVKQFTPMGATLRRATGWLYGINTLGAAVGCYTTGFHLIPTAGLYWTNWGIVILNLAIATVAVLAARQAAAPALSRQEVSPSRQESALEPSTLKGPSLGVLYLCATLTGCGALVLEMVWARQLALILGGSTYAFTAMLLLVLVGIGAGSVIFHLARERLAASPFSAPLVIAGLAASTAVGKLLIPDVTGVVGAIGPLRAVQSRNAAVCVSASAVLELLPAVGMGLLFPLLVHLTRKGHREAGRAVGGIYAFNTFGSIIGAAATSVVAIPLLGTAGSLALALVLYLLALILLAPPLRSWRASFVFFLACLVTGSAVFIGRHEDDPRVTNRGSYLYGPTTSADLEAEVLLFREGSSCNVLVTRLGPAVSLRVNGKVDASNFGDMKMQVGSAYVPLFLAPEAREVLVIGFGSGSTAGAALLLPEVRVTCCEIEPAVVAASRHFHEVNHKPEESPRFTVVHDDGRSYIQGMDRRFDLIISEPSNPWMAGLSNLYSREYYEIVRQRLTPGGILAQWIQTYAFSPADYALVVRTVLSVFPDASFVRISEGDTLLLASGGALTPTVEVVEKAQEFVDSLPEVREDLEKYFAMTDVRSILLTHLLLDIEGLRRLVARDSAETVNTDINLRLEFDAPLHLFRRTGSSDLIMSEIQAAGSATLFTRTAATLGCTSKHADAFHKLAFLYDKDRHPDLVGELIAAGLRLDPEYPELLADRLIVSPPEESEDLEAQVRSLAGISVREANRVAMAYLREEKHERARTALEVMASLAPGSVTTWTNLARAYDALEDAEKAEEAVEKALSLDPFDSGALSIERRLKSRD